MVKQCLKSFAQNLKQPYYCALFLLGIIPIFPEYISFFLVLFAAFYANKDMKLNKRKIRIGFVGVLLIAFCIYQTLTCIISINPFQSLAIALMWWFFFIGYLIVVNLLSDTQRFEQFLMFMTAAAGIVGLLACVQYRINFFIDTNIGNTWAWLDKIVFEYLPFQLLQLNYALRAYSTFPNPNMLAQYLVFVAPFVACFNFMEKRSKNLRLFSRTCLFLTFAGIMFSFSRGGYIAVLLLAIGLIVLNIRHKFAEVSLYIVSTVLFLPEEVINRIFTIKTGISHSTTIADGIITAPRPDTGIPPSITTSEIINNAGAETAVSERWEIWVESFKRFFERPLFGYGAGTETTFTLFRAAGINAPHSHNLVLQLLLEGGIIALAIMCLIGFKTIKNGVSMMRCGYNKSFWIGFAIVAFAVCFLTHGMIDYPLMVPRLVCMFCLILGIVEQGTTIYGTCPGAEKNNLYLHFIKKFSDK